MQNDLGRRNISSTSRRNPAENINDEPAKQCVVHSAAAERVGSFKLNNFSLQN